MEHSTLHRLRDFRIKRKYEILLLSFFILLFGNTFSPNDFDLMPFLLIQNVVASLVLFYGKKAWRLPLKALLITMIGIEVFSRLTDIEDIKPLFAIIYIIYFIFLSIELFRQILNTKKVTIEMVSAVLCGFIILGLTGTYIFSFVEIFEAGSFANLSEGPTRFTDLMYFSFISILSIGYGDIYPITSLAKNVTLFIDIIAHFYNVIVFGIVIGKYIARK